MLCGLGPWNDLGHWGGLGPLGGLGTWKDLGHSRGGFDSFEVWFGSFEGWVGRSLSPLSGARRWEKW